MYINLETCQITVCCPVKHFMAYYLAILPLPMYNVTSSVDHTVHLTKIITVNSFTNAHKKITLARFACLCFSFAVILSVVAFTGKLEPFTDFKKVR